MTRTRYGHFAIRSCYSPGGRKLLSVLTLSLAARDNRLHTIYHQHKRSNNVILQLLHGIRIHYKLLQVIVVLLYVQAVVVSTSCDAVKTPVE